MKPLLALSTHRRESRPDQLDTARWLARQSASSLYDALSLFLPPGASHRARPYLRLTDCLRSQPVHAGPGAAPEAARRAWRDESRGGAIGAREQPHLVVPALEEAGAVTTVYRVSDRLPKPRKERWIRLLDDPDAAAEERSAQEAIVTALRRRTRLAAGDADGFVPEADILGQPGRTAPRSPR